MNNSLKIDNGKNRQRIYFPELDGLRFFAFLLVFIHHHSLFSKISYFSVLHTNGWIGVDLFFALSAFLFTKLLIAEHEKTRIISVKNFYLRRICRVWPIYFLFIGFSITIYILKNGQISKYIGLRVFGLFVFSDNVFSAIYGYNPLPVVAHLWTIAYEEQIYIIIPIVILSLIRSSYKIKIMSLISVFFLLNLIRLVLLCNGVSHQVIWVLPITNFESIILGIVVGFGGFNILLKRLNPLIIGLIGILFFILVCLMQPFVKITYWLIISYLLVGLSSSMVLFSTLNSKYLRTIFSQKVFVFLGKRSLGLYVYHLLGNIIATKLILYIPEIPSSSFFSFIYSLSFTVIISIISYKVVETPFLILKKQFEVISSRPI